MKRGRTLALWTNPSPGRRRFAIAALLLISSGLVASETEYKLTQADWTLTVSSSGRIKRLQNRNGDKLDQASVIGDLSLNLWHEGSSWASQPAGEWSQDCSIPASERLEGGTLIFEYPDRANGELNVRYAIKLTALKGQAVLQRSVTVTPNHPPFTKDFGVRMGINVRPKSRFNVFLPRADGVGEQATGPLGRTLTYRLGGPGPVRSETDHLAIPLVSLADAQNTVRVTHIADPYFTTAYHFELDGDNAPDGTSYLTYVREGAKAPLTEPFTRTFWTVIHNGPPERAMDAWYATALADVPEGPAWLHDVAMQCYDYLSHGGRGWFEDIDAAEKLVASADRGKVVFALHGWYDMIGRYTFGAKTGKLDDQWVAFPSADKVKNKFPASESVKMTKADMHRRIKYAKDRGFRVVLYFADGLTTCEGVTGPFNEANVVYAGGWEGPDTIGKRYTQNPADPQVYKWYLDYHRALLNEYGLELDGLVWDETYMIRDEMLAPAKCPRKEYIAPAFLRLVKELTLNTTAFRKDLAFLTSDCQGLVAGKTPWLNVPPSAIMSHGTYQDTHCSPTAWPYAIFANYRNVLWSCNWEAVKHFDFTKFGVEHYGVPVAVSDGWLDDKGLVGLNDTQRKAVIDLFNWHKDRPQRLHWLTGPAPVFEAPK